MPDTKCTKYAVKSSNLRNSHKDISMPSTAFFSYFRSYSHIMWSPMKWNEQAQIHSDLHDWLGTSQHQCSVVFLSLSSQFHHRLAHDGFLSILTILTKHQAWAPVSPILPSHSFRSVSVELCFSPSANAWQQTNPRTQGQLSKCWNSRLLSSFRNLCYGLQCTMSPCVKTAVAKTPVLDAKRC